MELRWTVLDTGRTGAATDVVVRAGAGTTFDALLAPLRSATGLPAGDPGVFRVGDVPVGPELVVGLPPLLDGAALVFDRSPRADAAERRDRPLLELHVVAGPDAGVVAALPPAGITIGRSAEAELRLRDPELSRVHARIDVREDGVWVTDLGSTNGTRAGGASAHDTATQLAAERSTTLGGSTLQVRPPGDAPVTPRPDGLGHLLVNRPPSFRPPATIPEISYPAPPAPAGRRLRLPWPAMFLPMLFSVPMALIWHQPSFLLFAAMTPVLLLGQYLADRRSGRRDRLAEQTTYERDVQAADDDVRGALAEELARWEADATDLAALRVVARTPTSELWRRRPATAGFLEARLGRGRRPSDVVVRRPGGSAGRSRDSGATDRRETVHHPDAPVVVDLGSVGVLGVAGPRRLGLALARSLVGQLAIGCSPHDLSIKVLAGNSERRADWDWTDWLPHSAQHDSPAPEAWGDRQPAGHRTLVVIDGIPLMRDAVTTARFPGQEGQVVIWLGEDPGMLPLDCGGTVVCSDDGSTVAMFRRQGADAVSVRLDLPGSAWAQDTARSLAPLRDAGPGPDEHLPATASFAELMRRRGLDVTDPRAIEARWAAASGPATTATIGVGHTGPCTLDLGLDGPHALVGGTTGSGKSELLRTLIFGLAVEHPPNAVSFVLVDYKGGAAFRECDRLPHVTGVVTDLDNGLAARALTSLRAELRRRERLLATAGVADLTAYAERLARPDHGHPPDPVGDPGPPALPRLLIVVDEFRVLAEELPDFVSGLVRIASVGRSLGVHLVLATQRPAGVVSAEIRANTNLRIALRVRDRADSEDVVDSPLAAALPVQLPGRAILRSGGGELVEVQVARLSGPFAVDEAPTVVVAGPGPRLVAAPPVRCTDPPVTEADVVIDAVREAARARGTSSTAPPWLPPLPTRVRLPDVIDDDGPGLVFGMADDPGNQRRTAARWTLRGHLAVAGGPGSGRSTCLRTLVAAAAHRTPETHVYGVAVAAGLHDLAGRPHVGAVVAMDDVERVDRLFQRLTHELGARERSAAAGGVRRAPDIVLAVDGWEEAAAAWAGYRHGRLVDTLLDVMRRGGSVGVHVVVTGERAVLTGTPSSLLTERLLLRFADPLTATLAGVSASRVPVGQPPGRGLWVTDAGGVLDVQVALPDEWPPAANASAGRTRPWPVPELPTSLTRSSVLGRTEQVDGSGECLVVGVTAGGRSAGDSEGLWLPVDLDARPGAVVSVLGPPGSGRSTALASLAEAARGAGRDVVLVRAEGDTDERPGSGAGLRVVDTSRPDAAMRLAATLRPARRPVVLVDDAAVVDDELGGIVLGALPGASIVVAATAAEVLGSYGGLLGAARKARSGLVLGAVGAADGEALGVRLGPWTGGPPGRGWLVRRGRVVAVQVAMPDPPTASTREPGQRQAGRRVDDAGDSPHATRRAEGSGREPVRSR
jgi:S-DNA-T family DNA segregation ATPase FtsK/SpoIIIE